ncbi:alginate lyase family protein [Halorubrum cibi]|uniref:Alginate lyase n=1 Tax=Halorubrum cibi TaxID=413815 RepID=A0A521C551_9EURY|nr:alginate lyase family protein [Halorubrum cibi]SMO53810.1 Alginate lyase [Halorubrum cibi]
MTRRGPDDDPIRRRDVLRGVAALGTAAGVAGCGSDASGAAESPPTADGAAAPPRDLTVSMPRVYAGFLDGEEVAAIRRQVAAENDPWSTGYSVQLRDAERAMRTTPVSVVDDGSPDGVDEHRFATGEDRPDYHAAIDMGTWVRDLGIGYVFTGRERYARRAIELLDHWFLDPETRMYPSGRNFGETYFSIELHITVPTLLYGAALVRRSYHWSTVGADRGELRAWVRAYLADLEDGRGRQQYVGVVRNNIYAWWILARAAAAAYLGDRDALARAFDDWRENAFDQLESNGLLKHERQRVDGLHYSVYGLKSLALTAEIARHYGVDLYGYRLPGDDTSALLRAFEGLRPYILDPETWEWGTGEDGYTDEDEQAIGSVYELAYSQWNRPEFRAVVESIGRPLYDRRILGWTTLTHANRFELDID